MSNISVKLLNLVKQLYPTGRAFRVPTGGTLEGFHIGTGVEAEQFYNDSVSILDSILPDNSNFSTPDANDWEIRLGITFNPLSTLANRKAAILRKLQAPNKNPAKGHYLNLQRELQLAGFNLYVYENRLPLYLGGYTTYNPYTLYGGGVSPTQHGNNLQHGNGIQHGFYQNNKVANNINEVDDYYFDIGTNLRSTFFVGGATLGSFGSEPLVRKNELRELILKIKPLQTVGLLYVNFY